jgi:hypothetical protein
MGLPPRKPHFRASGHRLTVPCAERDSASLQPYPSQIAYSALAPPQPPPSPSRSGDNEPCAVAQPQMSRPGSKAFVPARTRVRAASWMVHRLAQSPEMLRRQTPSGSPWSDFAYPGSPTPATTAKRTSDARTRRDRRHSAREDTGAPEFTGPEVLGARMCVRTTSAGGVAIFPPGGGLAAQALRSTRGCRGPHMMVLARTFGVDRAMHRMQAAERPA